MNDFNGNNMYNKIRRKNEDLLGKTKKQRIVSVVVLVIFASLGFLLLAESGIVSYFFPMLKKPIDLETVNEDNIKPGMRVEGDILYVYDFYCQYTNSFEEVKTKEYFIPIGNESCIGMLCAGKTMNLADSNMNIYLEDKSENMASKLQKIHIKGTICKMEKESRKYYDRYLKLYGYESSDNSKFLPYLLKVDGYYFKEDFSDKIGYLAYGGAFFFVCTLVLISSLFNKLKKSV